jgi:hypothetical protein
MIASNHFVYVIHWDGRRWFAGFLPENFYELTATQIRLAGTVFDELDAFPYRDRKYFKNLVKNKKAKKVVLLKIDEIENVMGVKPEVIADYHKFDLVEVEELVEVEYD